MHLILLDLTKRHQFYPLTLSRPVWELRCGMTSLGEKLVAKTKPRQVSCFVPPYMAEAYREQTQWAVNDPASLVADDLLIVNGRVKADHLDMKSIPSGQAVFDRTGDFLFARLSRSLSASSCSRAALAASSLSASFESAPFASVAARAVASSLSS